MQVKSHEDRKEMPEECDGCGTTTDQLERFTGYGPGYQIHWYCPYCSNSLIVNTHTGQTLSAMFCVLEKRLLEKYCG